MLYFVQLRITVPALRHHRRHGGLRLRLDVDGHDDALPPVVISLPFKYDLLRPGRRLAPRRRLADPQLCGGPPRSRSGGRGTAPSLFAVHLAI